MTSGTGTAACGSRRPTGRGRCGSSGTAPVDLEAPHRRDADGIVSEDHAVDLVVRPDRSVEWKDLDELEGAVAGRFTRAQAEEFLTDAAAAEREVRAWASPFRDGWERWRPDPGWPRPELPAHRTADY